MFIVTTTIWWMSNPVQSPSQAGAALALRVEIKSKSITTRPLCTTPLPSISRGVTPNRIRFSQVAPVPY